MSLMPRLSSLLLVAVCASPVRAQTIVVPDFVVDGPTFGSHVSEVDVDVGTDGTITFLWGEYVQGAGVESGMMVTRQFDASGNALGPSVRVDTSKHALEPRISSDTRGAYVASWRWIQGGQHYSFFGQLLDAAGAATGDDFEVAFPNGGSTEPIGVAGLPSGSVYVWKQLVNQVWGQRYDLQGEPVGDAFVIGSEASGGNGVYDVAATPSGGFVAIWTNTWTTPFGWARVYDASGQPLGEEFPIGSSSFIPQRVAASPPGGFVASGVVANTVLNNGEIWIARFTEDGENLGAHRVEIPSNDVHVDTDLAIDAQGKAYVFWSEYQLPGEGARRPRARAFDPDGNAVIFGFWPTFDTTTSVATARLSNGDFVNAWNSGNQIRANIVAIPPPSGVVCGDGIATPGFEECDDGAANSDNDPDACRTNCLHPRCGDFVVDTPEGCDDGNTASCDGCSATCVPEPGYVCGDGVVEPSCGELCDDGGVNSGDGCAADCTLEPCTSCSGSPSTCTATPPADDCRRPVVSGKTKIGIKKHPSGSAGDKLSWKFGKGATTTMADLGDPTASTDYQLCIYEGGGPEATLLLGADIPGGGSCNGKPCWKMIGSAPGKGFKYKNKDARPDGVRGVLLKTGPDGRAKVAVKGRGASLALPSLPLAQLPMITVQLANDTGTCWSDTYSAPARKNDGTQFKDTGD